jgi:hypothetical protein
MEKWLVSLGGVVHPYASKAQQGLLHATAERGEISQGEIKGMAVTFSHLPEVVKRKKKVCQHVG